MNRIKLKYFTKGTYGNIYISDNYIYKITKLTHNQEVSNTNINEALFLKKFNDSPNIMQATNINLYNKHYFNKYFELLETKCNIEYDEYFEEATNYVIIMRMHYYSMDLFRFILLNKYKTIDDFNIIAKKLFKSLMTIHQNGFLHGDLKSLNVLINKNVDSVTITDFGGIKLVNCTTYHLSCTISSRCPEDLAFEYDGLSIFTNSNFKSDVWSLGILFMELILGYNPILTLYNDYSKIHKLLFDVENSINQYYKKNTITFNNYLKEIEKYTNPDIIKKMLTIDKMLIIDPVNRISMEDAYFEMFDENFSHDYIITYDYNYIESICPTYPEFLIDRKISFFKIIDLCEMENLLYMVPLMFDIIDRFYLLVNKKYMITIFNESEMNVLICSVLIIVSGLFNHTIIRFKHVKKLLKLHDKNVFSNVKKYVSSVLTILNYDVYRPFNIFNCPNNYSCPSKNTCTKNLTSLYNIKCLILHGYKDKLKLKNILLNIVMDEIMCISPKYYYDMFCEEECVEKSTDVFTKS